VLSPWECQWKYRQGGPRPRLGSVVDYDMRRPHVRGPSSAIGATDSSWTTGTIPTVRTRRRFGWLNTRLRFYPDTLNPKTMVHLRSGYLRPRVEVEPTDHPLAVEQRRGITLARVREIATALLHG